MTKKQKSEIFLKNLRVACARKGTSVSAMMRDLKMSTGGPSNWKKGGGLPNGDTLQRIAERLEVTVGELIAGTQEAGAPIDAESDKIASPATSADLASMLLIIREQQADLREANKWLREAFAKEQANTNAAIGEMEAQRLSFDKKWASLPALTQNYQVGAGVESKKGAVATK